jgi:cytosine/adenosine deaminase-related metal-dependent hydrolase
MLLRAKYLLWKAGEPPLENAVVEIRGRRIASIGKFRSASRQKIRDLGEVVLLPGLVNAHCHLNYTHLAGKIPAPRSFAEWLRQMIALKRAATPADFARATRDGLRQLQRSGVTTVCDIVSDTNDSTHWNAIVRNHRAAVKRSLMRCLPFLEILDLGRNLDANETVARALRLCHRGNCHLSPHSTYTVSPALFRRTNPLRCLRAVHIAESEDEWEMFTKKRGALFELVKAADPSFVSFAATTPVQFLHTLGVLTRRTLGVHLNYLAKRDFEIIARSQISVVHCPRSHEYFGHKPFAAERLMQLGVNVCLGTDSAATTLVGRECADAGGVSRRARVRPQRRETQPSAGCGLGIVALQQHLDMFAELRSFQHHHPRISPRAILQMATLNGARALNQEKHFGSIERGQFADLIAVPAPKKRMAIEEAIINSRSPVIFSMIGGKSLESKL